jgi:tetratricopeptide (TPR) repeat protein
MPASGINRNDSGVLKIFMLFLVLEIQVMKNQKILPFLRMITNTIILFTLMNSLNGAYKNSEKYFQFYLIAVSGIFVYGLLMYIEFLQYNRIKGGNKGSASVNPISEADVYLAYGRKEQAVAVLQEALRSDPNNSKILAKLESLQK